MGTGDGVKGAVGVGGMVNLAQANVLNSITYLYCQEKETRRPRNGQRVEDQKNKNQSAQAKVKSHVIIGEAFQHCRHLL